MKTGKEKTVDCYNTSCDDHDPGKKGNCRFGESDDPDKCFGFVSKKFKDWKEIHAVAMRE